MGSSKKHKEKRDRKKHKRGRSRSRERDSSKKSHKSSHRREKRKSPELENSDTETKLIDNKKRAFPDEDEFEKSESSKTSKHVYEASDDEFDVEKLLDSKLSENAEFSSALKRSSKKRRREEAVEEFRKRQSLLLNEDSLEKFATEQLFEEHGISEDISSRPTTGSVSSGRNRSPVQERQRSEIRIKEEPIDLEENYAPSTSADRTEPQLCLSIAETNKMRAKLGLKPLEVKRKSSSARKDDAEVGEANKLREKLGLKPENDEVPESNESHSSLSVADTNKLRAKLGLKPLDMGNEVPERSEPQLSLSVADTNKLRAKLGLKPLDVGDDIPGIDTENAENEISKPAAEIFVKTENISEKKKSEALREKLRVIKEKRAIEEKLAKTKGIADSDSEDESAATWVLKHQKLLDEKEQAEKRAKLLEEMDEEFGIGALVEEEFDKKKEYTSQNLKGLTIAHDMESFQEGHNVVLTLKDKGVLDEEEDVLENVNIVDNERYAKNVENKKRKPDYRPYEEPEYDEFGILKKKSLLSKYDEEIEGEKKKSFKIGNVTDRPYLSKEQELELIRMKLKQQNEITLDMPEMKIANEYYTAEDMVQFKKPKKKRKIKKSSLLKADDLLPEAMGEKDLGSRNRNRRRRLQDDDEEELLSSVSSTAIPVIKEECSEPQLSLSAAETNKLRAKLGLTPLDVGNDIPEPEDEANVVIEDQAEKELHGALNKARKLKQRKIMATAPEKVMEILNSVDGVNGDAQKSKSAPHIELNSVAEFCRTLGEIPTYGMSGNRDEEGDDMMDLERELMEERQKQELEAQNQGAWNEVDIEEKPAEIAMRENEPILEEEPDISLGLAGALKLATKKGYLDKEDKKVSSAPRASQLQAQSYTIEEKFYEDDKFGKRDRYTGPVQEFREKSNYKPDVKLEYIDDSGRILTAKEAFRYLSHKFHGKGPGKNKVDKRMKKLDQDTRLKQMSSTDTPLNTVKLLQLKQKETQSPYIVLSGGNKTLTQTMISKSKPV